MRLSTSITTSAMASDTPNHDGHSRECNRLITTIIKTCATLALKWLCLANGK